jgi:SAM-dependent methyltransferase
MTDGLPRLYFELADWYLLLTAPEDYAEEAAFYLRTITDEAQSGPRTWLELGAGSGNNAWHYKHRVAHVTLTDLSPQMLALSERQNPECEHLVGDMRTLRLGREFDAVFTHDAVSYLTTLVDLRKAMETAWAHCRPGGVVLFAPDFVRETFYDSVDSGGHDGADGRALRYLGWDFDPDPSDSTYLTDYTYLLHEPGQPSRAVYDQHEQGLFARGDWLHLLEQVGFQNPRMLPFDHSEVPPGTLEVFVATRPG